jgi:anion-transporting  ArsA/GET3 family ATPase
MLDMKRTWDDLIIRHAGSEERRHAILQNRFYQYVSSALAGSQEYMALEKLFELSEEGIYDAIVLDTPPTIHALDFLKAPDRLIRVLRSDAMRIFTLPYKMVGRAGLRMIGFANNYVLKRLAAFTGTEMLKELAEFMVAFEHMYDLFEKRGEKVKALLRSAATSFVVVTSPLDAARREANELKAMLDQLEMPLGAFIVNRVHFPPQNGQLTSEVSRATARAWLTAQLQGTVAHPDELAEDLIFVAEDEFSRRKLLAERDRERLELLCAETKGKAPIFVLPDFDEPVMDIPMLCKMAAEVLNSRAIGGKQAEEEAG